MSSLSVTLIDVGWGDSILLESQDNNGQWHYGLIDSNDTTYLKSSYIFLKRHFDRKGIKVPDDKPVFDFVLLSHAHDDHCQGLKGIIRRFGTKYLWYPKNNGSVNFANLLSYANRYPSVQQPQAVDKSKILPKFGDADMKILWPPYGDVYSDNENNNSVVLALQLGNSSFVLTGDAEEEVWEQIAGEIPANTKYFKVPHHGSVNGTFGSRDSTPWFDACPDEAIIGISSHLKPYKHPSQKVIDLFENNNRKYYRTDEHYHITVNTDGNSIDVKYSHI